MQRDLTQPYSFERLLKGVRFAKIAYVLCLSKRPLFCYHAAYKEAFMVEFQRSINLNNPSVRVLVSCAFFLCNRPRFSG